VRKLRLIDVLADHSQNLDYIIATIILLGLGIAGIMLLIYFKDLYNAEGKPRVAQELHNRNVKKVEDELLRAKQLLDSGILTQAEFDKKVKDAKHTIL